MATSKELSSNFARDKAIKYVNIVKTYLKNLNSQEYNLDRETAITALEELNQRLTGKSAPITHYKQSDTLLILAVNQIILNQKNVSPQLRNFWMAHMKMTDLAMLQNKTYKPQQFFDKNHEQINEIDKRYQDFAKVISKDKMDDVKRAYSVLYIHILKTEMIEYSFLKQFKIILKEFDLDKKYDPESIFSAQGKIRKGKKWKTDARAIRDALSHNKYTLEVNESSWKIEFNNIEERYNFQKNLQTMNFINI